MRNAWLMLTVALIVVDYFTKQYAVAHLTMYEPVAVTSFFNFTLIHNKGAAFGFLNSLGTTWVLAAISLIATGFFYSWFRQVKHGLQRCAIAMIMGGALGNFIDRAFYGYVIDFFDFHVGQHHWPAFNVADSAICVGVALLLLYWVKYERRH